jgi:hypothetical protein
VNKKDIDEKIQDRFIIDPVAPSATQKQAEDDARLANLGAEAELDKQLRVATGHSLAEIQKKQNEMSPAERENADERAKNMQATIALIFKVIGESEFSPDAGATLTMIGIVLGSVASNTSDPNSAIGYAARHAQGIVIMGLQKSLNGMGTKNA